MKKLSKGAHINFVFNEKNMSGVLRKLDQQSKAFKEYGVDVFVFSQNTIEFNHATSVIFLFKNLFLNKILKHFSIFLIPSYKNYDYLIIRYTRMDISILPVLLTFKGRVYIEQHSSVIDEIHISNTKFKTIQILYEKAICKMMSRFITGTIATTMSISDQNCRKKLLCSSNKFVLNNALDTCLYHTYKPSNINSVRRTRKYFRVVMAAGKFSEWHGLDRIIQSLQKSRNMPMVHLIIIGNIGNFSFENTNGVHVTLLGQLDWGSCLKIFTKCDAALDSMALDRLGLTSISTLKCKEYLITGLPVAVQFTDEILDSFTDRVFKADNEKLDFDAFIDFCDGLGDKTDFTNEHKLDWDYHIKKMLRLMNEI